MGAVDICPMTEKPNPMTERPIVDFLSRLLPGKRAQTTLFILCVAAFSLMVFHTALVPELVRALPVEVDDSINYMLRGAQFLECPRQDCRALEDVRPSLEPTSLDPNLLKLQWDKYTRLFAFHTPIHSVALAGFHKIGLNWIEAYRLLKALGAMLMVAGTSYWLFSLFGFTAGGLAALLVGLTYFVGHGYIWIAPGNISLGVAMIAWGLTVHIGRRAAWWILLAIVLATFMHSIGRGYGVVSVVAYFVILGRPRTPGDWAVLIGGLGAVFVYTLATLIISRPELSVPFTVSSVLAPSPLDVIKDNILEVPRITGRTVDMAGGVVPSALLVVLAVFLTERSRRRGVIVFLALLGGLAAFGLLHVWPRIPAELFARLWIGLAVLTTGCIAIVYCHASVACAKLIWTTWKSGIIDLTDSQFLLSPRGYCVFFLVTATVVLTGALSLHTAKGLYAHYRARIMITGRHDYSFDIAQVERIFSPGGSCGTIAYMREEPMHAYFLYGAMKCGAIFYPAARYTANYKDRLQSVGENRLTHVVGWNPMAQWRGSQEISAARPMTITLGKQIASGKLTIRMHNPGAETFLVLTDSEGTGSFRQPIPGNWSGWISFPSLTLAPDTNMVLTTQAGSAAVRGIRLGTDLSLNWPWDQGISMSFQRSIPYQYSRPVDISFSAEVLFPKEFSAKVVADEGFSVLGQIKAPRSP